MTRELTSPGERFRAALSDGFVMIPGAFNALCAKLAERAGFRAVYQSGAALSAGLAAVPDVGLMNQTEFATHGGYLASAVRIPVISDADTGFGEALAVERTVRLFEQAGLAGLHLEDQQLPKRCGHLSGKTLITPNEMVSKIRAAVAARQNPAFVIIARTDARSELGVDAAIERAAAYVQAGADMIFPEALETPEEFAQFAEQINVPLLANMTEFGKSPLLNVTELTELGFSAALYPVTLLRVAMKAVEQALVGLAEHGTQQDLLSTMQTRSELYELIGYAGFEARDSAYFGHNDEG